MEITDLTYFNFTSDLHDWLREHHATAKELWVGIYKKGSGHTSTTYPETLDEMLCFGWIDGIRKRVDDLSFAIRFTPRKKDSIWSQVNIKRVGELREMGRMQPCGLKVFEERQAENSGLHSFEQTEPKLDDALEEQFRADKEAWDFFQSQPPGYRRTAIWWVISPKREETKQRHLATLIEDSRQGRRIAAIAGDTAREPR
jgi:uncharacterized protein YdeI (YjbR/CyaY-like superfamily)